MLITTIFFSWCPKAHYSYWYIFEVQSLFVTWPSPTNSSVSIFFNQVIGLLKFACVWAEVYVSSSGLLPKIEHWLNASHKPPFGFVSEMGLQPNKSQPLRWGVSNWTIDMFQYLPPYLNFHFSFPKTFVVCVYIWVSMGVIQNKSIVQNGLNTLSTQNKNYFYEPKLPSFNLLKLISSINC